ncbi:hypothetical protein F511_07170 [Dorcoceras hygrometricum]|nr:hypothetical protein F511_07170 [Dorcoceras hygrometricum]
MVCFCFLVDQTKKVRRSKPAAGICSRCGGGASVADMKTATSHKQRVRGRRKCVVKPFRCLSQTGMSRGKESRLTRRVIRWDSLPGARCAGALLAAKITLGLMIILDEIVSVIPVILEPKDPWIRLSFGGVLRFRYAA